MNQRALQAQRHEPAQPIAPVRGELRTAPVSLHSIQCLQKAVGNQAVQALVKGNVGVKDEPDRLLQPVIPGVADSPRYVPFPFPHAERIQRSLGIASPFSAVHDQANCRKRGTPAFTTGLVTHFACMNPSLHVAAHEAAHQLQHAGITRDSGLGPEGHAGAVADAVTGNGPTFPLIGTRGTPVPVATRNYQETNGAGQWKDVEAGALFARLADTGEAFVIHSHDAYATSALITSANNILRAKRSGISISPGGSVVTVEAPDNSGSKSLSKIAVKFDVDPTGEKFYGDCRQAAREVMGPKDAGPEDVICTPGGAATIMPSKPWDMIPKLIFLDQRISATPDYDKLTPEQKREVAKKAYKDFDDLSKEEKDKLRKSPMAQEKAKALGMDQYAEPGVGEAFAIFRSDKAPIGEFDFHYATVIMVTGPDRVTLENAGGNKDQLTKNWQMQMYGPESKEQSFQQEHKNIGPGAHTVVVSTHPPAPAGVEDFPNLTTQELIQRLKASTDPNEQYYLNLELGRRYITAVVGVVKKDSWFMDDRVRISISGWSSNSKQTAEGSVNTLTVPIMSISPVTDPLEIKVEEGIIFHTLIGSVSWPDPYSPLSSSITKGSTLYTLQVSM